MKFSKRKFLRIFRRNDISRRMSFLKNRKRKKNLTTFEHRAEIDESSWKGSQAIVLGRVGPGWFEPVITTIKKSFPSVSNSHREFHDTQSFPLSSPDRPIDHPPINQLPISPITARETDNFA